MKRTKVREVTERIVKVTAPVIKGTASSMARTMGAAADLFMDSMIYLTVCMLIAFPFVTAFYLISLIPIQYTFYANTVSIGILALDITAIKIAKAAKRKEGVLKDLGFMVRLFEIFCVILSFTHCYCVMSLNNASLFFLWF